MTERPFSYQLPSERIAQRPVIPYDSAKLLVVQRGSDTVSSGTFAEIGDFLRSGDLLVFNQSRVIPARLFGQLASGAGIELLLLSAGAENELSWRAMGRPLKKLKPGTEVLFDGAIGLVGDRIGEREITVDFVLTDDTAFSEWLERAGHMPIPPYIRAGKSDVRDRMDYQTHFAARAGSVAAPTASLHFTPELLQRLARRGCEHTFLTLHVGMPSFVQLFDSETVTDLAGIEAPGSEHYIYDARLVERIAKHRVSGGRVVAVGTTVVRALESMLRCPSAKDGALLDTELFISPGFEFIATDLLVTNFHQPGTTHLLLVEALLGRALLAEAYEFALANDYRFLSYGDGMLICP